MEEESVEYEIDETAYEDEALEEATKLSDPVAEPRAAKQIATNPKKKQSQMQKVEGAGECESKRWRRRRKRRKC